MPNEIIGAVEKHPAIAIAGAGLLVIGYMLFFSTPATAQADGTAGSGTDYLGAPIAYVTGDAGGTFTTTTTPVDNSATGNITAQDILAEQASQDAQNYALSLANLQINSAAIEANKVVSLAGIQSSNYQAASQLTQSFFNSGASAGAGFITTPDGTNLAFNLQAVTKEIQKPKNIVLLENDPSFKALASRIGAPSAVQPSTTG